MIAAETGVANTVDPVAGWYTIETMTNRLEAEARTIIDRIDRLGGTLAAIDAGVIQREIQDAAYAAQQAIDRGQAVVVGVNRFQDQSSAGIDMFSMDPAVEAHQVARVRAVRASRSASAWQTAIDAVERAARDGANLVPPIIAAVEAGLHLARSRMRCDGCSVSTSSRPRYDRGHRARQSQRHEDTETHGDY